jgi:hypothetical protein
MKKGSLLTLGFMIFVGVISFNMLWSGNKYECEICITYKDQEVCQKVKGMDKNDTIMSGISTACAGAASGMTESLECQALPPTKLECKKI